MRSVHTVTREENWGTRFPSKYHSVFIMASDKRDALNRFNKHLMSGNQDCLKVSDKPLPTKISELHDMFRVKKVEILD